MKRFASFVGYLLLYLAVLAVVGELYLHVRGFELDNERSRDYWWIANNWWQGMSRADRPLALVPRAAKRVLVLGCSFTYGLGVKPEDTFCWLINQQQSEYYLHNCGIVGCGIGTALLQLPVMLQKHRYDRVVYAAIASHANRENDMSALLDDQPQSLFRRATRQYTRRAETPIFIYGALHRLMIFCNHKVWPGEERWRLVSFAHKAWLDQTYPVPHDNFYRQTRGEHRLRLGIRACYTVCHQHNIPFAVIELYGFNRKGRDPLVGNAYCEKPLEYFVNTPFSPSDVVPSIPII